MSRIASTPSATVPHQHALSDSTIIAPEHLPARPATAAKPSIRLSNEHRPTSWSDRGTSPDTLINSKRESYTTIDEKQWGEIRSHGHTRQHRNHDPEKAVHNSPRPSRRIHQTRDTASLAASTGSIQAFQSRHALRILLFLAGPCVGLSFLNLFWAILALLTAVISQPLRLCGRRLSFTHQIFHFLAPTLNVQLRCIYTSATPRPTEDYNPYSAFWLLFTHFLAPALSVGVAVAAWVVALYWALAGIVGDPSGVDKQDDGVEAVLGLRRWWETFLMKSVVE